MTSRRLAWAALLALAVFGAGCGSSGLDISKPRSTASVHWEAPPSGNPSGVVILIPGGGFERPTRPNYEKQIETSQRIAGGGYVTAVVRYRAGAKGLGDVQKVYEQAQKRYPSLPICAVGGSAGGTWALMLAAREPSLTCVVDLSGPSDLTSVVDQGSTDAAQLQAAFKPAQLKKFSPVSNADRINARVLAVYAENDPVVPVAQADELARALPSAEVVKLPPGPSYFVHSSVAQSALTSIMEREQSFLDAAVQRAASG